MAAIEKFKPDRRELYRLLWGLRADTTKEIRALQAKYEEAKRQLEQFKETNPEYLRLAKAEEEAREEYYDSDRKHDKQREKEIDRVQNHLQLHGATDQAVKMIERLIKKYRDHETTCMCVECMGG